MNLPLAEFGRLQLRGQDDCSFGTIDFDRVLIRFVGVHKEKPLQHLDDVVISMFIVVQENQIVKFGLLLMLCGFNFWNGKYR